VQPHVRGEARWSGQGACPRVLCTVQNIHFDGHAVAAATPNWPARQRTAQTLHGVSGQHHHGHHQQQQLQQQQQKQHLRRRDPQHVTAGAMPNANATTTTTTSPSTTATTPATAAAAAAVVTILVSWSGERLRLNFDGSVSVADLQQWVESQTGTPVADQIILVGPPFKTGHRRASVASLVGQSSSSRRRRSTGGDSGGGGGGGVGGGGNGAAGACAGSAVDAEDACHDDYDDDYDDDDVQVGGNRFVNLNILLFFY
jgi:hypothetical protein